MSHLKSLKEKLSRYGIDPFTLDYPINSSRGKKVDKNVCNDMCQAEILGNKKLNELFQERLMNKKVGFLNKEKQSQEWK